MIACSFCGVPQSKAAKLIAGPDVYICDECVGLCVDVLHGEGNPDTRVRLLGAAASLAELRASLEALEDRRRKLDIGVRCAMRALFDGLGEPLGYVCVWCEAQTHTKEAARAHAAECPEHPANAKETK